MLLGKWHPEAARNVFTDYRIKLMKSLPMGDALFLELLRKQGLLPGDLQEQVQAETTNANKVAWFLNHSVEPSLNVDIMEPLHKLLTVMNDDEYVNDDLLRTLAAQIAQKLDQETSLISSR